MALLKPLTDDQGALKAAFLGFAGGGKTFTASDLAIGFHKMIASKKPIAFFDTEGGSTYVKDRIKAGTGLVPIGIRARSLEDLVGVLRECENGASDILLVDSITHPWRECCDSYLAEVNAKFRGQGRGPRFKLEFQDWAIVKDKWNTKWATPFLNSPIHIIICGRAGDVYEYVENEDTGKRELQVTGVKMKTETEFAFEPSLICEMEQEMAMVGGVRTVRHIVTVIKDRFNEIQGRTAVDPTFDFFLPHLLRLVPGAKAQIDAKLKTGFGVNEAGDADFVARRKARAVLCEEILGHLEEAYPGQTAAGRKAKAEIIRETFGTHSWTKIQSLDEVSLAEGLDKIRIAIAKRKPAEMEAVDA